MKDHPPCLLCEESCGSQTEGEFADGLPWGQYWNVCSGCDEDGGWLFGDPMTTDTDEQIVGFMDTAADGEAWTLAWSYFVDVQQGYIRRRRTDA